MKNVELIDISFSIETINFLTGIFPSNMKTAKLFLFLKMEIVTVFPITDQFLSFPVLENVRENICAQAL